MLGVINVYDAVDHDNVIARVHSVHLMTVYCIGQCQAVVNVNPRTKLIYAAVNPRVGRYEYCRLHPLSRLKADIHFTSSRRW